MKLHPTQGLNGRVVFQRVTFFLCLLILVSGRAGPGVAVPDLPFTSPVLQPPCPGSVPGAAQGSSELARAEQMREAESEPQVETSGGRAGQEAQREVRGQWPQGPETGKYQ